MRFTRADAEDIWDCTAAHWDHKQAELYIRQLRVAIEAIARHPRLGTPCDDIRASYRKYSAGSRILFYRLSDSGVDVVRILHARMDFCRHL